MVFNRGNKSSGSWIRTEKRLAIYLRDKMTCVYCNRNMLNEYVNDRSVLTLDHVIPESNGGLNDTFNLITACRSCNSKRQNKPIDKFCSLKIRNRIKKQTSYKIDKHIEAAKIITLIIKGNNNEKEN